MLNLPGIYPIFLSSWNDCSDAWIISDPHFDDPDLIHAYDDRPSADEQVRIINSKAGKTSLLIVLGDVGDISYAKKLRAKRKILICGNHDAGASAYTGVFDEVYTGPLMIGEKLILSHEPIPRLDWAHNIHGHVHDRKTKTDKFHTNVCADYIGYKPISLNGWLKDGHLAPVQSLHRTTIDKATERRIKRGYKLGQRPKGEKK